MNLTDKKYVFLDIDGTLVASGTWRTEKSGVGRIDPAVMTSIEHAKTFGHCFGVMTGGICPRAIKVIEMLGSDFGLMELGLVMYHEGKKQLTVGRAQINKLRALRKKLIPLACELEFSFDPNERYVLALYPHSATTTPRELSERILETSGELLDGSFDMYYSSEAVDIVPKGVNKAYALKMLVKKMGIPRQSLIGIGDSDGDVPALDWIAAGGGTAVLVANSDDKTKKRLEGRALVMKNAESLGVSEFIEEHLLLEG